MSKTSPWPLAIIALFVAFIAGIVSFVVWTGKHRVDLVASDYYEQEIDYQARMDSRRRAAGANLKIHYDAGEQVVRLDSAERSWFDTTAGTVTFYRPSDAALDRTVPLSLEATGEQRIDTSSFPRGLWRVKVSWSTEHQDFFQEEVLVLE